MPAYDDANVRSYLDGLGIGPLISERIEGLIHEYSEFLGTPPEFIFVENPVNNIGAVEFSNLILLSGKMYTEFSLNDPNDSATFVDIEKNVNRVIMPLTQEMPFTNITARSRLSVQILNGKEVIGFFVASGRNCADLLEMTRRYFLPPS